MSELEIDKIIESVIDDVLDENGQPYKTEFKAFIKHVMMESRYSDDDVIERIKAIKIKESELDK